MLSQDAISIPPPPVRVTMVRGLASAMASISASCPQGSSKVRSCPSPSVTGLKPTARTTTSAMRREVLCVGRDQVGLVDEADSEVIAGGVGQIVGLHMDGLVLGEFDGGVLGDLALGMNLVEDLLAIGENLEAVFAGAGGYEQILSCVGCLERGSIADGARRFPRRAPTGRPSSRRRCGACRWWACR